MTVYGRSLLSEARRLSEVDGQAAAVREWWQRLPTILALNAVLLVGLAGWWLLARDAAGFLCGAAVFALCWAFVTRAISVGRAAVHGLHRRLLVALPWILCMTNVQMAVGRPLALLCTAGVAAVCTWLTQVAFTLPTELSVVAAWRRALVLTGERAMPALGMIVLGAGCLLVAAWSPIAIAWLPGLWLVATTAVLRSNPRRS
jgi:hypothetical protein